MALFSLSQTSFVINQGDSFSFIITNLTSDPIAINISLPSGDYTITSTVPDSINPGDSLQVDISTAANTGTGTVSIEVDATDLSDFSSDSQFIDVTVNTPPPPPPSIDFSVITNPSTKGQSNAFAVTFNFTPNGAVNWTFLGGTIATHSPDFASITTAFSTATTSPITVQASVVNTDDGLTYSVSTSVTIIGGRRRRNAAEAAPMSLNHHKRH